MPKLLRHILLPLCIAAAAMAVQAAPPAQQAAPRWEQMETVETELTDDVSVTVRDGHIYVTVTKPSQIKLFTILGQPISQVTLPPGTSRFKVTARGIYILKIGSITRRVTI